MRSFGECHSFSYLHSASDNESLSETCKQYRIVYLVHVERQDATSVPMQQATAGSRPDRLNRCTAWMDVAGRAVSVCTVSQKDWTTDSWRYIKSYFQNSIHSANSAKIELNF